MADTIVQVLGIRAEVEFSQASPKVRFQDILESAIYAALQKREVAFDRVSVVAAPCADVFLGRVIYGRVKDEVLADRAVNGASSVIRLLSFAVAWRVPDATSRYQRWRRGSFGSCVAFDKRNNGRFSNGAASFLFTLTGVLFFSLPPMNGGKLVTIDDDGLSCDNIAVAGSLCCDSTN